MPLKYIGTIVNTKSYKGKLFIDDVPADLMEIRENSKVYVGFSEKFTQEFILLRWKLQKNGALAQFKSINSDTDAAGIIEKGIFIDEESFISDKSEKFYTGELEGCDAIDIKSGESIGKIIEVWNLPANDVWLVLTEKGELPLPVIDDVISKVDISQKKIYVKLIPGLLDLLETESGDKDE